MAKIIRGGVTYDIVAGGSVVSMRGDDTLVVGVDNLEFHLTFGRSDLKRPDFIMSLDGPSAAKIELLNFDNPYGAAIQIRVGRLNERSLHLSVLTHAVSDPTDPPEKVTRLINYTFMLGEPV